MPTAVKLVHPSAAHRAAPPLLELERHAADAERLLRAMGSRHRLMILCSLAEGELSVGMLNQRVQLSQSALSQHLAVLRADGLVETRRQAQAIFYRVPDGPALQIIGVLHAAFCRTSAPRKAAASARKSTRRKKIP
ncbi:MAG: winged helix-turn-helix transcriptional regulator [Nevskia sp.]|nr:winged helix-turn-helix transcriptional regulator [Nevskia sp.]